ncbi:MAG: SIS domain-containing protein, partial [Sulfurifustis sp.]
MNASNAEAASDLLIARTRNHFQESVRILRETMEALSPQIVAAAKRMVQAILADRKILACGNGGSAADAQHFAAELVNRFERERPPLAAIALSTDTSGLTSIANDYAYQQVFSKPLRA